MQLRKQYAKTSMPVMQNKDSTQTSHCVTYVDYENALFSMFSITGHIQYTSCIYLIAYTWMLCRKYSHCMSQCMLNCLPHDVGEMLVRAKRLCVLSGVLHAMCAIGCATQSNARSAFIWPEELVCAKVSSLHS